MYKKDFSFFDENKSVYLDNAATTQKPKVVIDEIVDYYTSYCSNTHRSDFGDANKATTKFENTRNTLSEFINAASATQIIFTKGITEGVNFIANSFAKKFKTIIISSLEHHSNIVPWHMQGRTLHNGLEVVKCDENLDFDYENYEKILKNNPNSFVSVTHISNAFGVIHDIKRIIALAHQYSCIVMIDAAQSLVHSQVDVQDLDVDFFVISSHKTFGPTGVGALYVKEIHLNDLEHYQTGGATIEDVTYNESTLLKSPYKYEAGTQNISGVIGFAKALEYITSVGYDNINKIEKDLYLYLCSELEKIEDIETYNDTSNSIGVKSFNIKGLNAHDIGILMDKMGISVRVGHHCAKPIMKSLNVKGTIRVSLCFYNDRSDIDKMIIALNKTINMLKD